MPQGFIPRPPLTFRQKWFDLVWTVLSLDGLCDALGSAEYVRVVKLWEDNGSPGQAAAFIVHNANKGA